MDRAMANKPRTQTKMQGMEKKQEYGERGQVKLEKSGQEKISRMRNTLGCPRGEGGEPWGTARYGLVGGRFPEESLSTSGCDLEEGPGRSFGKQGNLSMHGLLPVRPLLGHEGILPDVIQTLRYLPGWTDLDRLR